MKAMSQESRERLDELLRSCIHCGLCLGDCPTYLAAGDEADSPRGRIMILAEMEKLGPAHPAYAGSHPLTGATPARESLDRCLGCRHCETVCPSGVRYADLLERGRERIGPAPGIRGRLGSLVVDHVLSRPERLAPLARMGQGLRSRDLGRFLPPPLGGFLESLPMRPARALSEPVIPAEGEVAILAGCAQPVFEPEVLEATARLIQAAGFSPCLPRGQGCCGAMSYHAGSVAHARELGRKLIEAMEGVSTVVIPSAGCSAHLRDYGQLFADDPVYSQRARELADASIDLVAWLDREGAALRFTPDDRRVAYHPPCHHRHAQGLAHEAHRLLDRVPGLRRVEIRDAERCCGSAGAYSLLQPQMAQAVRGEKIERLREQAPQLLLTANPGCEFFLESGLQEPPGELPVQHLALYLAERLAIDEA